MGCRRFAVLVCADDSDYMKTTYGGYFGIFKEMLSEEGESWGMFHISRGEFPDEADIEACEGFVITGSCTDAHGDEPWVVGMVDLLRRLVALKKRVLGICFGAQVLGRALGGKIGRAKSWDIGLRSIHFLQISMLSRLLSSFDLPSTAPIIQCHRDEVKELPPKAMLIAKSDKTGIEMFTYGGQIMGIQGHPEYTKDILLHLIDRLLQRGLIAESYANELRVNIGECNPDKELWRRICISFLKGGLCIQE